MRRANQQAYANAVGVAMGTKVKKKRPPTEQQKNMGKYGVPFAPPTPKTMNRLNQDVHRHGETSVYARAPSGGKIMPKKPRPRPRPFNPNSRPNPNNPMTHDDV